MDSIVQPKKSYPQNWKAYNAAQTSEKAQFLELLFNLCRGVQDPDRQTNGRPRLPLNDALFAICYKIYSTVSGRRFMSDLADAQEKGYVTRTPHFNSLFNYLENPKLTPILHDLITQTSLPLQGVEVDFAADSSGFSSTRYARWYDHKYGEKQQADWVKVHIMTGVRTNIITAAVIGRQHDTIALPDLLKATDRNFLMKEVSADKGYSSRLNHNIIEQYGATPFIKFKDNTLDRPTGDTWAKMFHFFQYKRDEYLAHYHKRSNVETTFSMLKAKFGSFVRSKTDTAMMNEALCKIICHNICVVIQETHELGVEANFGKGPTLG